MVTIEIDGGASVNKSAQYLIPLVVLASADAGGAEGFRATEVMKSAVTIRGQSIRYPATANPEVTAMLVELAPGGTSDRHQHPVPPYIQVLQGTLTVEFDDGSRQSFEAGRGFLEAVDTWHTARNLGQDPVKFLVVFMGEQGKSNFMR
jgi:quercetin dioxygenase-like cupin family protein